MPHNDHEDPNPQGSNIFSSLLSAKPADWRMLDAADYHNHTARGYLATQDGGILACLAYYPETRLVRLQACLGRDRPLDTKQLADLTETQHCSFLGRILPDRVDGRALLQVGAPCFPGTSPQQVMDLLTRELQMALTGASRIISNDSM